MWTRQSVRYLSYLARLVAKESRQSCLPCLTFAIEIIGNSCRFPLLRPFSIAVFLHPAKLAPTLGS